jgi:hypothetical protein
MSDLVEFEVRSSRANQPEQRILHFGSAATTSSVLVLHGEAAWVLEAVKKLEAIGRLQRNWDSYDGLPLTRESRELTILVLRQLQKQASDLPVPAVVLRSDGSIQLEWEIEGRELELGLNAGMEIEYAKVTPQGQIEEMTGDANNEGIIAYLTRWLRSGCESARTQ